MAFAAADVRTSKDVYQVLETITVTYSGMPGNSNDWISVAKASFTASQYIQYFYTGGKTSGTLTFNAIQDPGDYVVRAYFKNGNTIEAQRAFKVVYPTPQMSTDKSKYLVLEPVTVTYANLPGFADDYITIVPANAADNVWWEYYKTGGKKSGTMTFSRQLDPGNYEARLHYRNEDGNVRARVPFTVAYPNTTIQTDKTAYLVLEKVIVTYANMPGYADDYITVVPANAADNVWAEYYKTGGKKSGTMTFSNPLEPGTYEARVHYRNTDAVVQVRTRFTVAFPNTQVRTDKSSYEVGEKVVVTYSGMPGYSDDYITVVPAASPENTYWEWYKTGGASSGSMTFTRKLEAGQYEARVHYRNEDSKVRARAGFAVGGAACTFTLSPTSASAASTGGSGTINLTASAADCSWTAGSSDTTWLTVTPASGKGNATLQYTAAANATAASRKGTIAVGSQTFTLDQAGASGGNNLVSNPGAEGTPATTDCVTPISIPGWTITAPVSVCRYGGEYPVSAPGPTDRGDNYFAGGPANALGAMTQTIDLSGRAAAVDGGALGYTLSAWLGGWSGQNDNTTVKAQFKGAGGGVLGSATIGPVLAEARGGVTGTLQRTASGTVPSGARSVELTATFTRSEGSWNDSYADNISFVLGGGGTPPVCTVTISPQSAQASASGGTGTIQVTSGSGCAWTAASDASWLKIASGASGTGNGSVGYSVDASSSTSTRTGKITIGGQTFTLTQAAATGCVYALSHAETTVKPAGGSGTVLVTAGTGCSWTAASNVSWAEISSGATGSGNGSVVYTVAANEGAERTGTLTIAGRTFTIRQSLPEDQPVIAKGGVVNGGGYMPVELPGGGVAQGAVFAILGERLGPEESVSASAYPIETRLAEVGVTVTSGSTVVEAYPVMVSSTEIQAILPSTAPVGSAQVTVTHRGKTSAPAAIRIVSSNFAPFGVKRGRGPGVIYNYVSDAEQPQNTTVKTARPGQRVAMRGTGLGAITAPDNLAPPAGELSVALEVYVAHKPARLISAGRATAVPAGTAGVDQVAFELPADTPAGCYVPVQVKTAEAYSNVVTISVHPEGETCSDPINPFAEISTKGRKGGSIFLLRGNAVAEVEEGEPPVELTLDAGIGVFQESAPGGEQGYNPLFALPPVGTCTSYAGSIDASSLLGGSAISTVNRVRLGRAKLNRRAAARRKSAIESPLGKELDAGPALTITTPDGASIPLPHLDPDTNTGPYVGLLGGNLPIEGAESMPLVLNPGTFQVSGSGGKDVGPFTASVTVPAPITWTNRDSITEVDRTVDLKLTWSGGSADTLVLIGGAGSDQTTGATAGFFCFVPSEPGEFTVPSPVMRNMPAAGTNLEESVGALIVGAAPLTFTKFTATGLDSGLLLTGTLNAKMVAVK